MGSATKRFLPLSVHVSYLLIDIGLRIHTGTSSIRHKLTKAHALHALMGEFVLDTSGTEQPILPPGKEVMTLTMKGVCTVLKLRPELLRLFDKNKASTLAKTLVCCQALWFCIQCLGKIGQSLPLSLLEVSRVPVCRHLFNF